jgi:hypothetical protein
MNVEERIGRSLDQALTALDAGTGDVAGATARGTDIRRRRRVSAAALAAAAVVTVVAVVALASLRPGGGTDGAPDPAPPTGGTWERLAPTPLSPRWMPVAVWTGEEVVVVGGGVDTPCPPAASCVEPDEMARDGAAYDPDNDSWRRIADAPVDVGYWYRSAYVAGQVVLFGDGSWWAYDVESDTWHALPAPERRVVDTGALAERDGHVYALGAGGRVLVLDVAARTWSELPADPLEPALGSGGGSGAPSSLVVTDDAVLVSGSERVADWDGDTPLFTVVDRWDGSAWTRYPPTRQVGPFTHWTGRRLVDLDIQVATGLDGHPPFGGRLDTATREWSPLPDAPDIDARRGAGWSPVAADGPLMAAWGYAYDDDSERWTRLGKPSGTDVDSQQSAVWADGRLVVVAGIDDQTGYESVEGLSDEAWAWTP